MTALDYEVDLKVQIPLMIRTARYSDLPGLEWFGQFAHYRNLFKRSFDEQEKGNRLMLIADSNDFPIGRLFIQFRSRDPQVADGERRGYLYSFHVMRMFQNVGVGTKMLQEAEAQLISRNFKQASIAVAKENKGAIRFYQRHGYQVYGQDGGRWRYLDHLGNVKRVNEPAWLLQKTLTMR